jgi:prevent-host-death family protein
MNLYSQIVMPKVIETTKLRTHLASALGEVTSEEFFIVTKNGEPVAGIVSLDTLEDIEALKSKAFIESIKKAREEFKKGEFYTHEQAFGDI